MCPFILMCDSSYHAKVMIHFPHFLLSLQIEGPPGTGMLFCNNNHLCSVSSILSSASENPYLFRSGNSSTIVGLFAALLSSKAPLPGHHQLGFLSCTGKTMCVSLFEPLARNSILVCTAMNQAIDKLAWKSDRAVSYLWETLEILQWHDSVVCLGNI